MSGRWGTGGRGGRGRHLMAAAQRQEVVVLAEVQQQREEAEQLRVEAELQEEPVVVLAHAVVDPGHTPSHAAHACVCVCVCAGSHQGQWWSMRRTQWPQRLQW